MNYENEIAKNNVFWNYDLRTERNMKNKTGLKAFKEILESKSDEVFRLECVFNGLICFSNEDRSKSVDFYINDFSLINLVTYVKLKELAIIIKNQNNLDNLDIENFSITKSDSFDIDLFI